MIAPLFDLYDAYPLASLALSSVNLLQTHLHKTIENEI